MIKLIAKMIIALNSNSRPSELASGLTFGLWLALIPGGNLLWITLFIIAFFIKHNLAALFLSLGIFRLLVPLADPLLDWLGNLILKMGFLEGFFTTVNRIPLLPYSSFNNTLVMGGFIGGLILFIPVLLLMIQVVKLYRAKIAPSLRNSKLIKVIKKIPLVSKLIGAVENIVPMAG